MDSRFRRTWTTRPLTIGKLDAYLRDKSIIIQGKRTMEEMRTFIWKNGRPEAQGGYNDDLVMAFGIAMYIRDTALKFRQRGIDITKNALTNMSVNRTPYQGGYGQNQYHKNPYEQKIGENKEDIRWLF